VTIAIILIELLVVTLLWFIPIYVAHQIGAPKHRHGLLWGLCLGWLGVLVVALLPPYRTPTKPAPEPALFWMFHDIGSSVTRRFGHSDPPNP
jgi:hypothetical protein